MDQAICSEVEMSTILKYTCIEIQSNQIIRACAAMTEYKPRYKHIDCGIKICEPMTSHVTHTNQELSDNTYCMVLYKSLIVSCSYGNIVALYVC